MDGILLNCAGDIHQVLVDHWNKSDVMLCCQIAKDLVEVVNIFLTVVWREGDAGQKNLDMGVFESCQHRVEVVAGVVERQAAQAVVAAELDDHNLRMQA